MSVWFKCLSHDFIRTTNCVAYCIFFNPVKTNNKHVPKKKKITEREGSLRDKSYYAGKNSSLQVLPL